LLCGRKLRKSCSNIKPINQVKLLTLGILILLSAVLYSQDNWLNKVRIAGNPLNREVIDSIIIKATDSHVFGIEVDNDLTGRYDSFINPEEKLETLKIFSETAQDAGHRAFVYIAGLECITSNADEQEHSFYKDHPDWVQRDKNGKPALFGGGTAFWIDEGDEDVWISPYAAEWRKLFMKRVREIAETGIDGIYIDIPYWMTHFEGWEDSWASFDDYTVSAFKLQTGLNAAKDIELGNYNDPGFIKWIKFRINTLTEFLREIDKNIKQVNPDCKTIAEIYPGIGDEVPVVGTDVFEIYDVVDAIAHEYSEGNYYASDRAPFDWYNYIIGMHTFRAFGGKKPSWMLSYSWYNNEDVKPSDAMKSLFVSQLNTGTNLWDVKGFVMSSSNDIETRREVYKWVAESEKHFYSEREPFEPIGIYFSPVTRNLYPGEYIESYRGLMHLLINNHREFQIVTPGNLHEFTGKTLVFENVKCVSEQEIKNIMKLSGSGVQIIMLGTNAVQDENRRDFEELPFNETLPDFIFDKKSFGQEYLGLLKSGLNDFFNSGIKTNMIREAELIKKDFFNLIKASPRIKISAPIEIIASISKSGSGYYAHIIDIKELCCTCNNKTGQISEINIELDNTLNISKAYFLPFLGEISEIGLKETEGKKSVTVPEIGKGAVLWFE